MATLATPSAAAPARGASRPRTRTLLLLLIAAGALLRFWGLGQQGFWYDEAYSALLVHFRFGDMLGLIPHTESTPPLYYCLAWVWVRIFSDHEAGLRSLSAVIGVLVIPTLYGAALALTRSRVAALAAAALAAFSPLLIWYSQEARAYELLVLGASASWLCLGAILASPRPRWFLAWGVVGALTLASHYYAVVVLIPQALVLLGRFWRRPAAWAGVAIVAAAGGALLPLLITQNNTHNDSWIAHVPLSLRLGQILPQFVLGTGTAARVPLKFAAFGLAGVGVVGLVWSRARGAVLAAVLTVAGFGLAMLFVAGPSDTLLGRNLIGLWPGADLAVAGGLAALWRVRPLRWAPPLAVAGLCLVGVVAVVSVATTYALQRPNWRPVARLLAGQRSAANRLVLIQHYSYDLPLSLYLPRLRFARAPTDPRVGEIDVIAMAPEPGGPVCWWGSGCNLEPSALQRSYRIRGFRADGVTHIEQFSIFRLIAAHPRTVTRAEIARALVTTTLPRDVLLFQRQAGRRPQPA
ncbi:glycosyltransferase family 39 protein [Conexibacter sp. DBS9H8]|uniref:glycosyltransferase family 39 protein n=1 Tax=Conexibacter sp. DBS9H8 TaxID=2937801 RepID=UPI00200C5135|nr:glycosyltransferase family 39 protein [Conexibacter sp. DBS9H8]